MHHGTAQQLPIELYEKFIDSVANLSFHYADSQDVLPTPDAEWRATLIACAFVCKAWYSHSLHRLQECIPLRRRKQVVSLSKLLRRQSSLQTAIKHVIISGPSPDALSKPIVPQLGTFAIMLARKLPNLRSLTLLHVYWKGIRADTVRYLSAFSTITHLRLDTVIFVTASQFASLLAALPSTRYISCDDIECHQNRCLLSFPDVEDKRPLEVVLGQADDGIVEVLANLRTVRHVTRLSYGVRLVGNDALRVAQCQRLLDAYGDSLHELHIGALTHCRGHGEYSLCSLASALIMLSDS